MSEYARRQQKRQQKCQRMTKTIIAGGQSNQSFNFDPEFDYFYRLDYSDSTTCPPGYGVLRNIYSCEYGVLRVVTFLYNAPGLCYLVDSGNIVSVYQ
jgi:hypothetical protein